MEQSNKAILLLADGTVYHGKAAGAIGTKYGEIAFNTGMTGYQEIFTDPSYFGQIVVMATSHIGNYGINDIDTESDSLKISGLVCKKFSETFSRASATDSLQNYFVRDGIVGISDIDTRSLVRHIRNAGAMNAIISSEIFDIDVLKQKLSEAPNMDGLELSSKVTCKETFSEGDNNSDMHIALLDFGVKKNIIRCLTERGAKVTVFPLNTPFEEMEKINPDGYMLSNGPGDPSVMSTSIDIVKSIVDSNKPTFGICLGHQILSLSQGVTTRKMHNGHRGINHPILNLKTNKGEITSQNHGFVIDEKSIENNDKVAITHRHLNDDTVAGIELVNKPIFSVQYHPESSAGPNDSRYLFDQFITNIKNSKK